MSVIAALAAVTSAGASAGEDDRTVAWDRRHLDGDFIDWQPIGPRDALTAGRPMRRLPHVHDRHRGVIVNHLFQIGDAGARDIRFGQAFAAAGIEEAAGPSASAGRSHWLRSWPRLT
jgi:hypothetical protein